MKLIFVAFSLMVVFSIQAQSIINDITPQDAINFIKDKFVSWNTGIVPDYPWIDYNKFPGGRHGDLGTTPSQQEVFQRLIKERKVWLHTIGEDIFQFRVSSNPVEYRDNKYNYKYTISPEENIYIEWKNVEIFFFLPKNDGYYICFKKVSNEKSINYNFMQNSSGSTWMNQYVNEDDKKIVDSWRQRIISKDNETPIEVLVVSDKTQAERLCKALNFLVANAKAKNVEKF